MTNKAQRQTIHPVKIYLLEYVIFHGQLYVALFHKNSMQITRPLVKAENKKKKVVEP